MGNVLSLSLTNLRIKGSSDHIYHSNKLTHFLDNLNLVTEHLILNCFFLFRAQFVVKGGAVIAPNHQ